ncbi:MAG TPA: hypothetical protein VIZ43_14235 [Trebonia sp.]
MAVTRPEGSLARTHEGMPGLRPGPVHRDAAAGPLAVERLDSAKSQFADLNRKWYERALARHPEWPAVPGEAHLALSGATAELVRSVVRTGQTEALPSLEGTIVSLHLAVLTGRPWTA